jgi:hypothetical protein
MLHGIRLGAVDDLVSIDAASIPVGGGVPKQVAI